MRVFRHTLSDSVQLVSEVKGGFHQGGGVEGEGEGTRRFPGLLPATYTVLVYGFTGEEVCSPGGRTPDNITVATVNGLSLPSVTPFTSHYSVTMTGMYNSAIHGTSLRINGLSKTAFMC